MIKLPDTIEEAINAVHISLRQLSRYGVRGFDCSEQALATLEGLSFIQTADAKTKDTLDTIESDLGDCQRCGLSKTRRKIVFGAGDPGAELVFIGEGPGAEEDRSGQPFVGPAGELLTRIIAAMKLSREQVYICNVIKCRPPGNRNPAPEEIATCSPFLMRQLDAIAPKVICTLGSFATQMILNTQTPISRLRGRFHAYKDIKVMPTFHPAYLLRNPDQKRAVWDDMKKIMTLLRIPVK